MNKNKSKETNKIWNIDDMQKYYTPKNVDDLDKNDNNENLDMRMSSPAGGTFMHPMHDVTLDNYGNQLDSEADNTNTKKEKNSKV